MPRKENENQLELDLPDSQDVALAWIHDPNDAKQILSDFHRIKRQLDRDWSKEKSLSKDRLFTYQAFFLHLARLYHLCQVGKDGNINYNQVNRLEFVGKDEFYEEWNEQATQVYLVRYIRVIISLLADKSDESSFETATKVAKSHFKGQDYLFLNWPSSATMNAWWYGE